MRIFRYYTSENTFTEYRFENGVSLGIFNEDGTKRKSIDSPLDETFIKNLLDAGFIEI